MRNYRPTRASWHNGYIMYVNSKYRCVAYNPETNHTIIKDFPKVVHTSFNYNCVTAVNGCWIHTVWIDDIHPYVEYAIVVPLKGKRFIIANDKSGHVRKFRYRDHFDVERPCSTFMCHSVLHDPKTDGYVEIFHDGFRPIGKVEHVTEDDNVIIDGKELYEEPYKDGYHGHILIRAVPYATVTIPGIGELSSSTKETVPIDIAMVPIGTNFDIDTDQ